MKPISVSSLAVVASVATILIGGRDRVTLRAQRPTGDEPRIDSTNLVRYAYEGWAKAGRPWVARYTGTQWDAQANTWRIARQSPAADSQLAQEVYFAEYALRPALALAESQRDARLLDELARLYLAFRPRFMPLGGLRSNGGIAGLLIGQGPNTALVLPWYEHVGGRIRARECQLCAGQFLHPAARLIHIIAEVPKSQRTAAMNEFVQNYRTVIGQDFVFRIAFEASVDRYGFHVSAPGLLALWDTLAKGTPSGKPTYRGAMLDSDLWLLASAAELLTAASLDTTIENHADRSRLIRVVRSGTRFLEMKRHRHLAPDSSIAVSYFDGDFCDHPDMTYSGRTGSIMPAPGDSARACGASWDISHAYRIPIVLRSLLESRAATGLEEPSDAEVKQVTNEYGSRATYHVKGRLYFRSFFDGSDGWYRLYWSGGKGTGYPPPQWCDAPRSDRQCLSIGALFGWGLLSSYDARLHDISRELISVAASNDSSIAEYRKRYFTFGGQEFAFGDSRRRQPSLLLFDVVAESLPESHKAW